MDDLQRWREWLTDPAYPGRLARAKAARHGNRMAFESIQADYDKWRRYGQGQ